MRLKISPREAILKIDALVREGYNFLGHLKEDEMDIDDYEYILFCGLPNKEEVKEKKALDMYKAACNGTNFMEWRDRCVKTLNSIFQDFTPFVLFDETYAFNEDVFKKGNKASLLWSQNIKAKLDVLTDFYDDLKKLVRSPLAYLPGTASICFYDFICSLKVDSKEADLCKYMFDNCSIGEGQEFEDIYSYVVDDVAGYQNKWTKGWKQVVINAYEGINKKTNDKFGFSIFEKKKLKLFLTLPARLISSLG